MTVSKSLIVEQQEIYGAPFIDIQPNLTYLERFTDFEIRSLEPLKDVRFIGTRFKLLRAYIVSLI